MRKLVYGAGINNADYETQSKDNGIKFICPFYKRWFEMLKRCYSRKYIESNPTYSDCKVCDSWLKFSNFKAWMETQDWQGKELDKDVLFKESKLYSPETCVFISHTVNSFFNDCGSAANGMLTGTSRAYKSSKFQASCQNPFTKRREHLGTFECRISAHLAWKRRKHELACQLAATQGDERVSSALISRYI